MDIYSHFNGLVIGLILAINDVISLGITKSIYLKSGIFKNTFLLIIPCILYALQIPLFYLGLFKTPLVLLNIYWDLISDILITLLAFFYFKEKLSFLKMVGLIFASISIIIFTIADLY